MQSHQGVALGEIAVRHFGKRQKSGQRIDHDIADAMDFRGIDSLIQQVLVRICGRRKEKTRELVGYQTVDLFGHAAVAGAKTSFNMPDGDQQFGTDYGGSHCGIHVSVNQNEIGFAL